MTSDKIRQKFIKYFKKNNHKVISSSSLWPADDPSVLLTSAGMQQFKPYFMDVKDAQRDFNSSQLTSYQRCFRTSDIEEVGDTTHNTLFEMLGNFSLGGYFKEDAIKFAWDFLTKELHIEKRNLWATYYKGDKKIKKDEETLALWKKFIPKEKIIDYGKTENWWGPPGNSGPCGASSELHYDLTGKPCEKGTKCLPNCTCGRFMELWNLVFMQYHQDDKKKISSLPKNNIDTGLGLERLAMVVQKKKNIFETDLFDALIKLILNDKKFGKINRIEDDIRCRIAADHLKGSIFLLADGINFSNKEQGCILRRIFRRALDQYLHANVDLEPYINLIIKIYQNAYPHLLLNQENIIVQINKELATYNKVLELDIESIVAKITNLKHQTKKIQKPAPAARKLSAQEAFTLYSSYGISMERLKRKGFEFSETEFKKEVKKHQNLSRVGAKNKFGGHGISSSEWDDNEKEIMKKYHTATHLLHQALRIVLGDHVKQQGSNINPERLRFDFEHHERLSDQEKQKIEQIVNKKISEKITITSETMIYQQALTQGALAFFKEKYPDNVTVYSIGDFSKELCGGPHVKNTSELGIFSIISEKSSSAGVRRIKAKLS